MFDVHTHLPIYSTIRLPTPGIEYNKCCTLVLYFDTNYCQAATRMITIFLTCVIMSCFVLDIQGVSRLVDITAGGDFLRLCDQESS